MNSVEYKVEYNKNNNDNHHVIGENSEEKHGETKQYSYKLLVDPFLQGTECKKVYRFDGIIPEDPMMPLVMVKDPRRPLNHLIFGTKICDLILPRLRLDKNYIGEPPALELTVTNINDNIREPFLQDLCFKHGVLESLKIYYHPTTKKHLTIARVIYKHAKSAKQFLEKMHNVSVMGNPLKIFLDPLGKHCHKIVDSIIRSTKDKPFSIDAYLSQHIFNQHLETKTNNELVNQTKSSHLISLTSLPNLPKFDPRLKNNANVSIPSIKLNISQTYSNAPPDKNESPETSPADNGEKLEDKNLPTTAFLHQLTAVAPSSNDPKEQLLEQHAEFSMSFFHNNNADKTTAKVRPTKNDHTILESKKSIIQSTNDIDYKVDDRAEGENGYANDVNNYINHKSSKIAMDEKQDTHKKYADRGGRKYSHSHHHANNIASHNHQLGSRQRSRNFSTGASHKKSRDYHHDKDYDDAAAEYNHPLDEKNQNSGMSKKFDMKDGRSHKRDDVIKNHGHGDDENDKYHSSRHSNNNQRGHYSSRNRYERRNNANNKDYNVSPKRFSRTSDDHRHKSTSSSSYRKDIKEEKDVTKDEKRGLVKNEPNLSINESPLVLPTPFIPSFFPGSAGTGIQPGGNSACFEGANLINNLYAANRMSEQHKSFVLAQQEQEKQNNSHIDSVHNNTIKTEFADSQSVQCTETGDAEDRMSVSPLSPRAPTPQYSLSARTIKAEETNTSSSVIISNNVKKEQESSSKLLVSTTTSASSFLPPHLINFQNSNNQAVYQPAPNNFNNMMYGRGMMFPPPSLPHVHHHPYFSPFMPPPPIPPPPLLNGSAFYGSNMMTHLPPPLFTLSQKHESKIDIPSTSMFDMKNNTAPWFQPSNIAPSLFYYPSINQASLTGTSNEFAPNADLTFSSFLSKLTPRYKRLILHVIAKLLEELTGVINKDIQKNLVQKSAFLLYDNWWSFHEKQHQEKKKIAIPSAKTDLSESLQQNFSTDNTTLKSITDTTNTILNQKTNYMLMTSSSSFTTLANNTLSTLPLCTADSSINSNSLANAYWTPSNLDTTKFLVNSLYDRPVTNVADANNNTIHDTFSLLGLRPNMSRMPSFRKIKKPIPVPVPTDENKDEESRHKSNRYDDKKYDQHKHRHSSSHHYSKHESSNKNHYGDRDSHYHRKNKHRSSDERTPSPYARITSAKIPASSYTRDEDREHSARKKDYNRRSQSSESSTSSTTSDNEDSHIKDKKHYNRTAQNQINEIIERKKDDNREAFSDHKSEISSRIDSSDNEGHATEIPSSNISDFDHDSTMGESENKMKLSSQRSYKDDKTFIRKKVKNKKGNAVVSTNKSAMQKSVKSTKKVSKHGSVVLEHDESSQASLPLILQSPTTKNMLQPVIKLTPISVEHQKVSKITKNHAINETIEKEGNEQIVDSNDDTVHPFDNDSNDSESYSTTQKKDATAKLAGKKQNNLSSGVRALKRAKKLHSSSRSSKKSTILSDTLFGKNRKKVKTSSHTQNVNGVVSGGTTLAYDLDDSRNEHAYSLPPSTKKSLIPIDDYDEQEMEMKNNDSTNDDGLKIDPSTKYLYAHSQRLLNKGLAAAAAAAAENAPSNVTVERERKLFEISKAIYGTRDPIEEMKLLYDMWNPGIDLEDLAYLRVAFERLYMQFRSNLMISTSAAKSSLNNNTTHHYWLQYAHWVPHMATHMIDTITTNVDESRLAYSMQGSTLLATYRKRHKRNNNISSNANVNNLYNSLPLPDALFVNKSGSARSEGYVRVTGQQKAQYVEFVATQSKKMDPHHGGSNDLLTLPYNAHYALSADSKISKNISNTTANSSSRQARSEFRRQVWSMSQEMGDLVKFNQLKARKKQLAFRKSAIHDWGLYAQENIAGSDEMIIEYVGEIVRQITADRREKILYKELYGEENTGSYLFRIDADTIIDATRTGNLARFINHSCNPNCYAKIITVGQSKKIVIYSKQPIKSGEEITYDYKFPIEDEKIPCLCGAYNCRGTLN